MLITATIADSYEVQTQLDMLNLKTDGSDSDSSFVVVEKMMQ